MSRADKEESSQFLSSDFAIVPGRLDTTIKELGMVDSRTRAQRLIQEGSVWLAGAICRKPAARVEVGDLIRVDRGSNYASRGAYKLAGALKVFQPLGLPSPKGHRCLDVGASTGGFTDLLLRRGADHVIALDVGHDQLLKRIAQDPRVIEMSGVNIRQVNPEDLPYRPDYVVSDVSFISLTYVIPVITRLVAPQTSCILLVKPQFEVGRDLLGHQGIVSDETQRRQCLDRVIQSALDSGFDLRGQAPSPIRGIHGNVEYLLWISKSA